MMLQNFIELKEFIEPMNTELADIMLSAKEMLNYSQNFQSITMELQKVIDLYEVRVQFDATIKESSNSPLLSSGFHKYALATF